MFLYPQLGHAIASQLADERRSESIEKIASLARVDHTESIFTPTGGTRVDESQLTSIRDELLATARTLGYPDVVADQRRLTFDVQAAMVLHRRMNISPTEASRAGVWEFMTCVMLCDLVRWRWATPSAPLEPTSIDRFLAGRRNTFQRLWWRAHFLYSPGRTNPYVLLSRLGEDEVVQIMERPYLAGNRKLSRAVAEELLATAQNYPAIQRRILIREAQKRIRRLAAFVSFEAVDDTELLELVRGSFDAVVAAVGQT